MSSDLPDYTKLIAISVDLPDNQAVIPRPKGGILESGTIETTANYQTVASHVVTDLMTFQLSKIMVSCEKAAYIKLLWNSVQVGAIRQVDDMSILFEHFPWDYKDMDGNGIKVFEIQAKWFTETGTVEAEIVGEEIVT